MRIKGLLFLLGGVILSCSTNSSRKESTAKNFDLATINTAKGKIIILLYNETPRHKASFIKLVKAHYFDSLTFNRVIENFVIQGGCPDTPAGFSDSPYLLEPEFNQKLRHIYGAVGAGRDNNPDMLSAGCQFYIVQNKEGLHRLDDKYTVFGRVVKGMDVVDKIAKVATDSLDAPIEPIGLIVGIEKIDSAELYEKYLSK